LPTGNQEEAWHDHGALSGLLQPVSEYLEREFARGQRYLKREHVLGLGQQVAARR
jgi:hypothetical protein